MSEIPRRLVWLEDHRIITQNADGGTTGWSEGDAERLWRSLGEILMGLGVLSSLDALGSSHKGGGGSLSAEMNERIARDDDLSAEGTYVAGADYVRERNRLNARLASQADALRFVLARIPEDHRYDEMRRVINGALGE